MNAAEHAEAAADFAAAAIGQPLEAARWLLDAAEAHAAAAWHVESLVPA